MTGSEVFKKATDYVYSNDEEGFASFIESLTDEERTEYEAYMGGILNLINKKK